MNRPCLGSDRIERYLNAPPYTSKGLQLASDPTFLRSSNQVLDAQHVNFRGTQLEYSSKPLRHSIVKRILVFKRSYRHIFIP